MKSVLQWMLGRAGLYLLLVAALLIGPLVLHALAGTNIRDELMSPQEVSAKFQELQKATTSDFDRRRAELLAAPPLLVDRRLQDAQVELAQVREGLAKGQGWFASVRPQAILERKRLELRRAALEGEIQLFTRAREGHRIGSELHRTTARVVAARNRCDAANANVRMFNQRQAIERSVRNVLTREAQQLTEEARRQCLSYANDRGAAQQRIGRLQAELAEARRAYTKAGADAEATIRATAIDLKGTLRSVLFNAAVLLIGIISTPYLVRLAFYFVLAPLASRRPPVRIIASRPLSAPPLPLAKTSGVSASVTLRAGETLLVRQGFLQTTSSGGAKATQGLLDWRHPLSSLASGLSFLTRVEGAGDTTTISAVNDPFAEVTVLELPAGAGCVLQPRALAAVAQFSRSPLRVTSHWRLGSLHAWLTLQLRYIMFHGPVRLVIKGARGVRVEPAERGRVFGQDQLVGFSADLSYSVTRTETFWPYFFGLESLLKDKVEGGDGVLILEEAPMIGADGRRRRKGLEGMADVLLKAVGI